MYPGKTSCIELIKLFKSLIVPSASTDHLHNIKLDILPITPFNGNSIPENNNWGTKSNVGIVEAEDESLANIETKSHMEEAENIVNIIIKIVSIYQLKITPLLGTSTNKTNAEINRKDWITESKNRKSSFEHK